MTKALGRALLIASLGLAAFADVHADDCGSSQAPVSRPVPYSSAPTTTKAVTLPIAGVAFGQSPKNAGEAIDKILDDDYRPLYRDVQPGAKMKALDVQLAEDKAQFRRSRTDFGQTATSYDQTALRGEYTYKNKEALLTLARKGRNTYFFFIQERLWKIIDEPALGASSALGKSYAEAVVKLNAAYGIAGRLVPPDGAARFAIEVDWKDSASHLRAIQRGEAAIALAYEDNATLAKLDTLRPNKSFASNGVDPAAAALMGRAAQPSPPCGKGKSGK